MSEREKGAIIMLAGPIKHWWDANWDTPEHWHYAAWRDRLNDGLVANDYLVYRPHEAFKGAWTERAQSVNDLVLRIADVILDMTPEGIPSLGTDAEKQYAQSHGNALVLPAPPTPDIDRGVQEVMHKLDGLNIRRAVAGQEVVIESFGVTPERTWMIHAATQHFTGQVIRLHHEDREAGIEVTDSQNVIVPNTKEVIAVTMGEHERRIDLWDLRKLEVLARPV